MAHSLSVLHLVHFFELTEVLSVTQPWCKIWLHNILAYFQGFGLMCLLVIPPLCLTCTHLSCFSCAFLFSSFFSLFQSLYYSWPLPVVLSLLPWGLSRAFDVDWILTFIYFYLCPLDLFVSHFYLVLISACLHTHPISLWGFCVGKKASTNCWTSYFGSYSCSCSRCKPWE